MDSLYLLLHMTDSLFPSGTFAHSSGLEGLLERRGRLEATALQAMAAAAVARIDEAESLVAWGYQTIAQMTAALMRLGIVGHRAAVALLGALRGTVEAGVRDVLEGDIDGPSSFAPALEIASARHER